MSWATALHRAMKGRRLTGCVAAGRKIGGTAANLPMAALLRAPLRSLQLLRLALVPHRELDADATALELTGDSRR